MLLAQHFDLARFRGVFSTQFRNWDAAVAQQNTASARRARAEIRRIAFSGLSEAPATLGGFYLFVDLTYADDLGGLNYVGIADAKRRPIGRRITDRLRDDSALDVDLDVLDYDSALQIVHARLVCALPRSGHNYVSKHMKIAELFRRSPSVILVGCETASPILIREAERLLISSAVLAGAPLTNIQQRQFRGPASRAAFDLATAVINGAKDEGLPEAGANDWQAHLRCVVTQIA